MKTVTISDIQYTENGGDRFKHMFLRKKTTIKISVNGITQGMLSLIQGYPGSPWSITFNAMPSAVIRFQASRKNVLNHDVFLGSTEKVVGSLNEHVTSKLYKYDGTGDLQECQRLISFNTHVVEADRSFTSLCGADPQTDLQVEVPGFVYDVEGVMPDLTSVSIAIKAAKAGCAAMNEAPLKLLLSKVEKFTRLVNAVAGLHPYAKAAWGAISAISNIMVNQMHNDEHVKELIAMLDDTYTFLVESAELKKMAEMGFLEIIGSQLNIITAIFKQTTECAYFIQAYVKDTGYWARIIVSEADDKIQGFHQQFSKLKSDFQAHALLQTEISVFKIRFSLRENLRLLETKLDYKDLIYAPGSGYKPEKQCLVGTRLGIIDEICTWAQDLDSMSQIFWLRGLAGTGKSSIAHSVGRHFADLGRLGSFFCFDVSSKPARGPEHLFSTISVNLAGFDEHWRATLWDIIKDDPSLRTTDSIQRQFAEFILKPASSLKVVGPIVIVIDALDECGDASSRKALLRMLATNISTLPENFRVLVTSRPEKDIISTFESCSQICIKDMDSIGKKATCNDIFAYFQASLSEHKSDFDRAWSDQAWCHQLVEKAEGLFQWASTACLFINDHNPSEVPINQLNLLLHKMKNQGLDKLYHQILTKAFPVESRAVLKVILGTLIVAKEPLTVTGIAGLNPNIEFRIVKQMLQQLGSLFRGVSADTIVVEPLHTSVRDFLLDKNQSYGFTIDKISAQKQLLMTSLSLMESLKFNICQLPTSYLRNNDIDGLEEKINRCIPSQLLYACCFWAYHLEGIEETSEVILGQLETFTDTRILYWLEVLSLTRRLPHAIICLQTAATWIKSQNSRAIALSIDTQSLVSTFWKAISESAGHIYISALAFCPKDSILLDQYGVMFGNRLKLKTNRRKKWPGSLNVLEGHTMYLKSVAVSPNGAWIASGSQDKTIQLWDAATGSPIGSPFEGHTGWVESVAFSPDGAQIVSGSQDKTIRLWDAATGHLVGSPFEGHMDWVRCVAFSPNGSQVVSGSYDKTVRLWDTVTGNQIGMPFEGHTGWIQSVAFSPNGIYLVSGSYDKTIRIWSIISGNAIGSPLEGHTEQVQSVAFSPDGTQIVSGSEDNTIRLWNTATGRPIGNPFEGHTDWIQSVAFSPNGTKIVSGSIDHTIRLWDVATGSPIGSPFEGHTGWVQSVVFSPNGTQIVSGSHDKTIRLWDPMGNSSFGSPIGTVISPALGIPLLLAETLQ